MNLLLCLIPLMPFAGFLFLILFGSRVSRRTVGVVGCSSVGSSAILALWVGLNVFISAPEGYGLRQTLWRWMAVDGFEATLGFYLDTLSLTMVVVITLVGFLIHLYSSEYMVGEEGYSRFFAYMNLFVGFMLTLVLADNLVALLLGWEGVGLCSYLLIGFWHRVPAHGYAARKAFVVTRIGDTALILGVFLLFHHLGTVDLQEILRLAPQQWSAGSTLPVAAALLVLGGALGKSAQLPLQTWLPDAMAGPTPVSALIHAATMVTAGVYLIARLHGLFELAPQVMQLVSGIGALTLLLAGCSALVQRDLKRVLAYSTMSQIGYMFLALGVGAWTASLFHFMTHAFFKALLFLAAGAVIQALHHEQDLFNMGGLHSELPLVFWTFLAGAASLMALPWVTAGFYSKELILSAVWTSDRGGRWLWAAGVLGALITAAYTSRMVILAFFGTCKSQVIRRPGKRIGGVLVALAILSITGGFVETPSGLGGVTLFSLFLSKSLPPLHGTGREVAGDGILSGITIFIVLAGVGLAFLAYARFPRSLQAMARSRAGEALHQLWFGGWGFDWLYDRLFRQPWVWLAQINRQDALDSFYTGLAGLLQSAHRLLSQTQTGYLRWYAAGISIGVTIILALILYL